MMKYEVIKNPNTTKGEPLPGNQFVLFVDNEIESFYLSDEDMKDMGWEQFSKCVAMLVKKMDERLALTRELK